MAKFKLVIYKPIEDSDDENIEEKYFNHDCSTIKAEDELIELVNGDGYRDLYIIINGNEQLYASNVLTRTLDCGEDDPITLQMNDIVIKLYEDEDCKACCVVTFFNPDFLLRCDMTDTIKRIAEGLNKKYPFLDKSYKSINFRINAEFENKVKNLI